MSGQPKVSFQLGQGNLGRPLTGFDHYSLFKAYYYAAAAVAGYTAITDAILTSLKDAEAKGIVNDFADATAATSVQTVTAIGANGDTVEITILDYLGNSIELGEYLKVTGDSTVTLVATGIVAAINAQTYLTGFSATVGSTGAYTITAPKRWGVFPNTKSVTNTITGTVAITNAAFANGTKSWLALFHYQLSEYFRGNPNGIVYFSIGWDDSAASASTFNAQLQSDLIAADQAFQGQARQVLAYNPGRAFASSTLTALKAVRTSLSAQITPGVMLYGGNYSASAVSALANMRLLSNDGVGCVIGQSGTGVGLEYSYTQIAGVLSAGLLLGINSVAKVSQSIAEVQVFNLTDGVECDEAHFYDRTNYTSISPALADQLHDFGYIYLRKFPGGFSGTYFNNGNAAVSPSSDYANLEDSRTIDKAIRNVYQSIISLLKSKNRVKADGTLSEAAISQYNEKCQYPLEQMVRDEDLSAYTIAVSRTEVVTTTKRIPITIGLQQQPNTDYILITIGFVATV